MKKVILAMIVSLFFSGCASLSTQQSIGDNSYRQVSMDEAIDIMNEQTGYIILDVRRVDEFASGHIPGAINIPNESIGTNEIPQLPDKNQMILIYCRSGRRSKEASQKLANLGYTNIVEFGGILDWPGDVVTE
jgi:rhodanese-related sulfurtransferase